MDLKGFYEYDSPGCDRLSVIGNIKNVSPGFQNHYCSMQILNDQIILCSIHLPSNLHASYEERSSIIREIILELEQLEEKISTKKTLIVGDMNDSPYEYTCLAADTLHGIPSFDDARRISRISYNNTYQMFYNPMWNLFGDRFFPPGTYYYADNAMKMPYWYMYDQVLIRPQIRNLFVLDNLKIIFKTSNRRLIDENNHPTKSVSDHLPIIFELID